MSDEVNENGETIDEQFVELAARLYQDTGQEVTEATLLRLRQRRERFRQEIPLVQGLPMYPDGKAWTAEYEHHFQRWEQANQLRAGVGQYAWDGMILMSVYCSLAQTDDDRRESELLDLAAIVISAYEASRKRRASGA